MHAPPFHRSVLLAVVCLTVAHPACADEAIDDDARTARSWAATAAFATRQWLEGSLPNAYVVRTLDSASDALGELARSSGRGALPSDPRPARIARLEATVLRLHQAADDHDLATAHALADTLEHGAQELVGR